MPLFTAHKSFVVLGSSAIAVPLTGTTSETALATITIPAGAMGANGILRVSPLWSYTANANNKTLRCRLGGLAGTIMSTLSVTTLGYLRQHYLIHNRNSAASQIAGSAVGGTVTSSVANQTGTINTAAAQDLVISVQLADGADTVTLESYVVELLHQG